MITTIHTVYGHQTFKTSSNKVNVFAIQDDNVINRVFPSKVLTKIGLSTGVCADGFDEKHGVWYSQSYRAKNDVLLMYQFTESYRGAVSGNAAVFLRLRDDAPVVMVTAKLQPNVKATYKNSILVFSGRADVFATKEEAAKEGIVFPDSFATNYMDEEEIEELVIVQKMNNGRPPPEKVKVKTKDGKEKTIKIRKNFRRRLRVK